MQRQSNIRNENIYILSKEHGMKTKKDFYFIIKQVRHLQKKAPGIVDCLMLQREVDKEVESFYSKEIEENPIDVNKKKIECQKRMKVFYE